MIPQAVTDVLAIVQVVWQMLGPVATAMVEKAINGGDPADVLLKENVVDILPIASRTELAMIQARMKAGSK